MSINRQSYHRDQLKARLSRWATSGRWTFLFDLDESFVLDDNALFTDGTGYFLKRYMTGDLRSAPWTFALQCSQSFERSEKRDNQPYNDEGISNDNPNPRDAKQYSEEN